MNISEEMRQQSASLNRLSVVSVESKLPSFVHMYSLQVEFFQLTQIICTKANQLIFYDMAVLQSTHVSQADSMQILIFSVFVCGLAISAHKL